MKKQTVQKRKTSLKKEHFEILLENIDHKFDLVMEGYQTLNNKIESMDARFDALSNELHSTREELIFLIKTSVEQSEIRLTRKIEDGDNAVIEKLTRKIEDGDNAVIEKLTKKIEDGDNAVIDKLTKKIEDGDNAVIHYITQKIEEAKKVVMTHTDRKIDEIKNILKIHADRLDDHEDRLTKVEHKQ